METFVPKWKRVSGLTWQMLDVVMLLMAGLAVPKNLDGVGPGTRGKNLHPAPS